MGQALIARRGTRLESDYAWKKYKTRSVVKKTEYDTAQSFSLAFIDVYLASSYTVEDGKFVLASPTYWEAGQQVSDAYTGYYAIAGSQSGTKMYLISDGIYVPPGGCSMFDFTEVQNIVTEEYDITYVVARSASKHPNGEMADNGYYYVLVGGGDAQYTPFESVRALYDADGTFSAPSAGTYRVTAIGHGASGVNENSDGNDRSLLFAGGCGGGGYLELRLAKGEMITITVSDAESAAKNSAGVTLVAATAASGKIAGSASGLDGVVAFASNGQQTPNIVPPSAYNSSLFLSQPGRAGRAITVQGTVVEEDDTYVNIGGVGLFGGDGGDGGNGVAVNQAYAYSAAPGVYGGTSKRGSGAGGDGKGAYEIAYGSVYSLTAAPGGSGGGGYGGGGGAPEYYRYYRLSSDTTYYYFTAPGEGGAGCVMIERIA